MYWCHFVMLDLFFNQICTNLSEMGVRFQAWKERGGSPTYRHATKLHCSLAGFLTDDLAVGYLVDYLKKRKVYILKPVLIHLIFVTAASLPQVLV